MRRPPLVAAMLAVATLQSCSGGGGSTGGGSAGVVVTPTPGTTPSPAPSASPTKNDYVPKPYPTNSTTSLVTSAAIPFDIPFAPPFPHGRDYAEYKFDNYSSSPIYVDRTGPSVDHRFGGIFSSLTLNSSYDLRPWTVDNAGPQDVGIYFQYDSAAQVYIASAPGLSRQLAFGPANVASEDAKSVTYTRSTNPIAALQQEVLSLKKVGSGTDLPRNRYVTMGYFGSDHGTIGYERSDGFRYQFAAGSPTYEPEIPTSGTREYEITGIKVQGYWWDRTLIATVNIRVTVDFGAGTAAVHLERTVDGLSSFANPFFAIDVLARKTPDYVPVFRGDATAPVGDGARAVVQVFGPDAGEIAVAFGFGWNDARYGFPNPSRVFGVAVGVQK